MKLKDILTIAFNIKRIKGLTNNEFIHQAIDNISDVIQFEISSQENDKSQREPFLEIQNSTHTLEVVKRNDSNIHLTISEKNGWQHLESMTISEIQCEELIKFLETNI